MTTITAEQIEAAAGSPQELDQLVRRAALEILHEAEDLQHKANNLGFILTIETKSLMPPAMGNYDLIATLRPSHDTYRSES